jgi:hypothetical protein
MYWAGPTHHMGHTQPSWAIIDPIDLGSYFYLGQADPTQPSRLGHIRSSPPPSINNLQNMNSSRSSCNYEVADCKREKKKEGHLIWRGWGYCH